MNRREFIYNVFLTAGIGGLYRLGIGAVKEAQAWGILPAIVGLKGSTLWAQWNEKTEDVDGINITIYDGGATDDETGLGIVTGADLIHTQAGAVGAAVNDGGYFYRPMDGGNDLFTVTDGWFNGPFQATTEYTLVLKCYIDNGTVANDKYFWFEDANIQLTATNVAGSMRFDLTDADNGNEAKTLANNIATMDDEIIYIAVWCDKVTSYAGVSRILPTKKSDFAANDLATFAALFDNFPAGAAMAQAGFFNSQTPPGRIYFVAAANDNLINNAL